MLTNREIKATAQELSENFKRLGYEKSRVAQDMRIEESEIDVLLQVNGANPGHVWMLRDYLEDMLEKEGRELYPFTRLADHSANRWFHYETPWRNR